MLIDPKQFEAKPYVPGHWDCYGTFREAFMAMTGEILPDFARPHGWWNVPELNLVHDLFEKAGFEDMGYTVNGAQPLDVLLFAVASSKINHVGLYLGNGSFLHHPYQKLSIIEPLSGAWKSRCIKVIRHENYRKHNLMHTQEHINRLPQAVRRQWIRSQN